MDHAPHPRRAGFSLIELLVVMAVLSVLAAIAIPRMTGARDQAMRSAALSELRMLDSEVRLYEVKEHELPPDLGAVERDGLVDPWGVPYTYAPGGGRSGPGGQLNTDYDLYSLGPDGVASGDDVVRARNGTYFGRLDEL